MEITKGQIKDFYNKYSAQQINQADNERHFYVLDLIKKNGLQKNSNVLDLGCGIGSFTALIAEYCSEGKIKGFDISDKSIEIANKTYSHLKNLSFSASDITNENFSDKKEINFVLLVDVLEHIPREEHETLFRKIESILTDHSKLIINIPYAAALEYERKNNKEALQIIDEPVELSYLSSLCHKLNLEIKQVETFDMWQKEEYQFIVVEKKKDYVFTRVTKKEINFLQRLFNKLKKYF